MTVYINTSQTLEKVGDVCFRPGVPVEVDVKNEVLINHLKHIPSIAIFTGNNKIDEPAPEPKVVVTTKEQTETQQVVNPETTVTPEEQTQVDVEPVLSLDTLTTLHWATAKKLILESTDKELLQKIHDEAKAIFAEAAKERLAQLHATGN